MKRAMLLVAITAALPTGAVAQSAPPGANVTNQQLLNDPPATLDNLWDASRRTNKLLEQLKDDTIAIRAAMPNVASAGKKSAVFIDFGTSEPLPAQGYDYGRTANTWCRTINYAAGKVVWASNNTIIRMICYD